MCNIFESKGATTYFVELEAELDDRLVRNKTPHRLEHKLTKRDIEWSENNLIKTIEKYRLNSIEDEIKKENYLKINNTNLSADEVANLIKERFDV